MLPANAMERKAAALVNWTWMKSRTRRAGGQSQLLDAKSPQTRARRKQSHRYLVIHLEQWDAAQADRYLNELDDGIQPLAGNPEMGAKRDYLREGYRVLFINSHAIYYTLIPSAFPSGCFTARWTPVGINHA
jgi:plasmid stabilization system protein ParE